MNNMKPTQKALADPVQNRAHRFEATVKRFKMLPDRVSIVILLEDIVGLDRDHVWVKQSKRLKEVKIGDRIQFTARVEYYLDSGTLKPDKAGLRHIRNVKVVPQFDDPCKWGDDMDCDSDHEFPSLREQRDALWAVKYREEGVLE